MHRDTGIKDSIHAMEGAGLFLSIDKQGNIHTSKERLGITIFVDHFGGVFVDGVALFLLAVHTQETIRDIVVLVVDDEF